MAELTTDVKVALSYLDDVDAQIASLKQEENYRIREHRGNEIITGDIALARREAVKADPDERNIILSSCDFAEGRIWLAVAAGHSEYAILDSARHEMKTALSSARQCFLHAIEKSPSAAAYYNLALTLEWLDRKPEALAAYNMAMKSYESDGDTAEVINVKKAIGRMGDVKQAPVTSGETSFGTKKEINWALVKSGSIVSVVGLLLVQWLPIILIIGIAMVAYAIAVGRKY